VSTVTVAPGQHRRAPAKSRDWGFLVSVLIAYLLARGVSAVLLVVLTRYQVPVGWTGPDVTYGTITGLWDAGWYREIATNGYPEHLPVDAKGEYQQNAWAFYPLYPMLVKGLMAATGSTFALAGSTLSLVLGGCAALVIAILLRDRVGPRTAFLAVIVWSTCAPSPVLQVAYTESLAILLLALVLLHLERGNWWLAGVFACLTGLARPVAVPLGAVALVAVWLRWRVRRSDPVPTRERIGMLAALAGCGLAGLAWPAIAWIGTGSRSAYTDTMATWRSGQEITPLKPWVSIASYLFHSAAPLALVAAVVLIVGMAAGPWAWRLGPVLRAWCLFYPAYLAVVLDPTTSIFRYLLPLFPWAVIAIDGAWRQRRPVGWRARAAGGFADAGADGAFRAAQDRPLRMGLLTLGWVALGLVTQWWWLYELWRFVPPSDFPP